MKFIINKEIILDNLQKVLGPATTKQNFPILNSVLLTTFNNKIKFTTTDLDVTIITLQEATIDKEGSVAIPMKRLLSIIRELPPSEIIMEVIKNNLLIKCEKIEFKINTLNPQEFPQIEEEKNISLIKINPQILEEMIRLTSFCVGYEDVNYVLNGILFEFLRDEVSLISTDGKRLACITQKLPPNQPEIKTKLSFILPIKAINELYKLIKDKTEDIFMFAKENKIGFDFKETQFIARPIEGEFPNYAQYIPQEKKDKLTINRQNLLLALRRADLLSTPDYQGVKLEVKKDSVTVLKTTPQLGEVKENLEATYEGTALEIGFNPQYLMDVLKNLDDPETNIEFFGSDKPAVVRRTNYIYLVLPIKM